MTVVGRLCQVTMMSAWLMGLDCKCFNRYKPPPNPDPNFFILFAHLISDQVVFFRRDSARHMIRLRYFVGVRHAEPELT